MTAAFAHVLQPEQLHWKDFLNEFFADESADFMLSHIHRRWGTSTVLMDVLAEGRHENVLVVYFGSIAVPRSLLRMLVAQAGGRALSWRSDQVAIRSVDGTTTSRVYFCAWKSLARPCGRFTPHFDLLVFDNGGGCGEYLSQIPTWPRFQGVKPDWMTAHSRRPMKTLAVVSYCLPELCPMPTNSFWMYFFFQGPPITTVEHRHCEEAEKADSLESGDDGAAALA